MIQKNLTERVNAIQSTAEVIAHSLKEMIYEAELKPGQQLVQETIARMFQVSRVPVRDALQILIKTGIAVNGPRRGVIVRPLSRRALLELFEVRKILEGSAIRMAIGRITPDLLMELNGLMREQLDCIKTKDVKRQEKLDDAFHRTLYEAVENATLMELIFSNWERIKQARCSSTVLPEHGQRWITESIKRHKKVLEALRKKDELLAYQVIVDNIESSQEEITSCLEKMEWIEPEKDASSNPK
jgi:DNA-binding GntR family transcriptional regulator